MTQFSYTIQNPIGIDLRRTGLLTKLAQRYGNTAITIEKDGQRIQAGHLTQLMRLGVKNGDQVTVTASGPAEHNAMFHMRRFFEANL